MSDDDLKQVNELTKEILLLTHNKRFSIVFSAIEQAQHYMIQRTIPIHHKECDHLREQAKAFLKDSYGYLVNTVDGNPNDRDKSE